MTARITVSDAVHATLRHAWLKLCASDMVDPRLAPHPWSELDTTATGQRITIDSQHVAELLMVCAIAFDLADGRDARAISSFVGKVSQRYPEAQPMSVDQWKAAHRRHALPPLHSVDMTDARWQDVHDVWFHVR